MTTENCSIFNLPGCSFLEEYRCAIPTHGVVDAYASSTCAAGYALALGANPFNVTCVNTFNGHLIQPQGTTTLGKARTIKEYLKGWAALDSQYDYDLIGDVKLP